jgi:hypothetical protein
MEVGDELVSVDGVRRCSVVLWRSPGKRSDGRRWASHRFSAPLDRSRVQTVGSLAVATNLMSCVMVPTSYLWRCVTVAQEPSIGMGDGRPPIRTQSKGSVGPLGQPVEIKLTNISHTGHCVPNDIDFSSFEFLQNMLSIFLKKLTTDLEWKETKTCKCFWKKSSNIYYCFPKWIDFM